MRPSLVLAACLTMLGTAACGGQTSLPPDMPCVDASAGQSCATGPDRGGDDASAGADSSGARDGGRPPAEAGACGTVNPLACNTLENVGTVVTATCVAGSPPTMTGGAIADGTYVLVAATGYASSCAGLDLPTGGPTTLAITAGCEQSIDVTGGAQSYAISTDGSTLTLSQECPSTFSAPLPYTATPTTLSTLGPFEPGVTVLSVFRKL